MGKVKSIVITVVLALLMAVAAVFAFITFPGKVESLESIVSRIPLGAEYSGYAYTTITPKGVLTAQEYNLLAPEDKTEDKYTRVGSLYVKNEEHDDMDALKAMVAEDAKVLSARLGEKGYSTYKVAVEDGLALKLSVPTNYCYAEYKSSDKSRKSSKSYLDSAASAFAGMIADGTLTLRTSDKSITITSGTSSSTVNCSSDELTDKALTSDGSKTYLLTKVEDDASDIIKSVSARRFGSQSSITFRFTKEGREKFKEITTLAASSSSKIIYFFIGDTQVLSFNCKSTINSSKISLQTDSLETAENAAITLDSAINGSVLQADYNSVSEVLTSSASGGEKAALLAFVAALIVLAILVVVSVVLYKKLGIVNAMMVVILALVEIYALYLISLQVTFAVIFAALIGLGILMVSNAIVFAEVKRLVATGRTMQASIKEAYKNVLMSVTDIHIVLLAVALLLATVAVGELAVCGLILLIATIGSYLLYWFTRFMWYVLSSPARDKFAFAGLKRVVYEDDE